MRVFTTTIIDHKRMIKAKLWQPTYKLQTAIFVQQIRDDIYIVVWVICEWILSLNKAEKTLEHIHTCHKA